MSKRHHHDRASRGVLLPRRSFLQYAAATAGSLSLASSFPLSAGAWQAADGPSSDQLVTGKVAGMIVRKPHSIVLETPLEMLRKHPVTPKDVLFVRNNQELEGTDTTQPLPLEGWQIEVEGRQAEEALEALSTLVAGRFGEED